MSKPFKRITLVLAVGLMLLVAAVDAQRHKPTPRPVPPKPVSAQPLPGYDFEIKVFADGSAQLRVLTGYESRGLSNALLEQALTEYVGMTKPAAGKKVSTPRVFIRPEPEVDLGRLIEIARTARRAGPSQLQIVTPDDIALQIGLEPKNAENLDVKPNPLFLMVAIHKDKSVTLNNESFGTSSNTSPLGEMLTKVFRERENNGLFRPNSSEVEKTLHIRADLPARFSDLIAVAKAVSNAGAGPIYLVVDDDDLNVNKRLDLVPVP